jgi:hypothetical protein
MRGIAIRTDYENNNPDWDWTAWENKIKEVRGKYGFVAETDEEIVTTNGRVVEELKNFAENAPGWEDSCAPQYAPNPILFLPCDTSDY